VVKAHDDSKLECDPRIRGCDRFHGFLMPTFSFLLTLESLLVERIDLSAVTVVACMVLRTTCIIPSSLVSLNDSVVRIEGTVKRHTLNWIRSATWTSFWRT